MERTLAKDVRWLGDTLGETLRTHGGEILFGHVETMRRAAKRARDAQSDEERAEARDILVGEAKALDVPTTSDVVRAFTQYFRLVNLAEDVHRTRELRRREIEGGSAAVAESLHAALTELVRRGATREQVLEALSEVSLTFVFTSHPTEARRRTTERLLARVREILENRDRHILTPTEDRMAERRLRATVEALWEHEDEREARPEVLEEVKAGLWYLRNVMLDQLPRVHRRLHRAIELCYGPCDPLDLPMNVRFGSWMGSDRDGNPYVTDAVMERTLELHRWIVLDRYLADLDALVDPLSASARHFSAYPPFEAAMERAKAAVPEVIAEAERRNPREPLRKLLTFMRARIERTRSFSAGAYARPDDFLDDLLVLRSMLQTAHASALPDDTLLDLIQRVRCFGFMLAALDVREDGRVHRRVVGELLGDPSYAEADDAYRLAALARLTLPPRNKTLSPDAKRLLDLFETLSRLKARFGDDAVSTYIISMTQSPVDVLEILRLAELHRLGDVLDIVPLLETRDALANAGKWLEALFADARYGAHLERRGRVQELLVGYSDSMKEAGMLASRVAVLDAQCAAANVCREHGVTLRIFHGRGGSVSRGGGPTYRAIRALPRSAFSGTFKITEQGETRANHFSHPDLAVRYVEQTLGAALVVRFEARASSQKEGEGDHETLNKLAKRSHDAYRELVTDAQFLRYFTATTPLDQIAALNIASRPARRGKSHTAIEDLRAIPWVFSWSQSRVVLTGWYGVGSALASFEEEHGAQALARLYRETPFFRDLLDNVQMTLAKADFPIAERYASLCTDDAVRQRIFGKLRDEFERTRRMVLKVTGQTVLLEDDRVLQRSIRLRNPYVDPLSYLQVEALRRLASMKDEDERAGWERVVRLSVQGVAAGLRNTG